MQVCIVVKIEAWDRGGVNGRVGLRAELVLIPHLPGIEPDHCHTFKFVLFLLFFSFHLNISLIKERGENHLQLPNLRGQAWASMGKSSSCIGHSADMVSLERKLRESWSVLESWSQIPKLSTDSVLITSAILNSQCSIKHQYRKRLQLTSLLNTFHFDIIWHERSERVRSFDSAHQKESTRSIPKQLTDIFL